MGRLVLIVGREDLARYEHLASSLTALPIDLILDRRREERRRHGESRVGERRRGDRRARTLSEIRVPIEGHNDVISARHKGRALAAAADLPPTDGALVATAVSSLTRNIVGRGQRGELVLRVIENRDAHGMEASAVGSVSDARRAGLVAEDGGPTFAHLHQSLVELQHLAQEFHVTCELAPGLAVAIRRWGR